MQKVLIDSSFNSEVGKNISTFKKWGKTDSNEIDELKECVKAQKKNG